MRSELRGEMLRILGRLSEGDEQDLVLTFNPDPLRLEAVLLLTEHGALEDRDSVYRITISGYDYYEQLKSPVPYWVKRNWFPLAVLVVSSVVTVAANVIAALLRSP